MTHTIAVITGGESAERVISLRSAENIARIIGIHYPVKTFIFPEAMDVFIREKETIDLAVPVMHGKGGEDGEIQRWLKKMDIPFIFSPSEAHEIALQKDRAKERVHQVGVASPEGYVVQKGGETKYPGYPVVVKPGDGGSSVATCIAASEEEYQEAIKRAAEVTEKIIVERRIVGREFTVGVIDGKKGTIALPVVEIVAKSFFDYEQKYSAENLAEEVCPARIDGELAVRLQEIALKAHKAIGCTHMTRTDIMMDEEGGLWFLEINTIPGYTATSLMPKMLKTAGISEENLFQEWIEESLRK